VTWHEDIDHERDGRITHGSGLKLDENGGKVMVRNKLIYGNLSDVYK
jgi:hypothetical protein